jgi:hypothetical protein
MGGWAGGGELVETPMCGFGGASFFGQHEIINDSGAINATAKKRLLIKRGFFLLVMV